MEPKGIQAKISAYIEKHPELRLATQDTVLFEMQKAGEITAAEIEAAKKGNVWGATFDTNADNLVWCVLHDDKTKKDILFAEGVAERLFGIPADILKESQISEKVVSILSNANLEVTEENIINVMHFLGIIQVAEPQKPTKEDARAYLASYMQAKMDEIVSIYEQVNYSIKPGTRLLVALNDGYDWLAEKVNNLVGAPLLNEGDNSSKELYEKTYKLRQKISSLTKYGNSNYFDKKFKEVFPYNEINYDAVIKYMEAQDEYARASAKDKNNPESEVCKKLMAAQEAFDKANPLSEIYKEVASYTGTTSNIGGLLDLGLDVYMMHASGIGMAFGASSAYMGNGARYTAGKALEGVNTLLKGAKVAKGAQISKEAIAVSKEYARVISSLLTNAMETSAFFNATEAIEMVSDGKVTKEEGYILAESYKGLFNFTMVGGALAGPLGAKVSELTSKLFNSERAIASTIKIAVEGKGTTLDKVLKALSENSNAISKVAEFGTSFSINAGYMAAADGMSLGEAMGNLAQMDAVSKLVVAMLGGKNVSFLTPQKVQQIKTDLAGYDVKLSVYKGKKVYEITDKTGAKTRVEDEQGLFNFIVAREVEMIEGEIQQPAKTDVKSDGKEAYTSPESRYIDLSMTDGIMSDTVEESLAAQGKSARKSLPEAGNEKTYPDMSKVETKLAAEEELREIHKIDMEAFDGKYEILSDFEGYKADLEADEISTYAVKSADGQVIGYYQLEPAENGELYIHSIGVRADLRSSKASYEALKQMQENITNFAKENNIAKVVLDVDAENAALVKLYKKFGFEITDESRGTEAGRKYHDYRMEIDVKKALEQTKEGSPAVHTEKLWEDNAYNRNLKQATTRELKEEVYKIAAKFNMVEGITLEEFMDSADTEEITKICENYREIVIFLSQKNEKGEYLLKDISILLGTLEYASKNNLSAEQAFDHAILANKKIGAMIDIYSGIMDLAEAEKLGITKNIYEYIEYLKQVSEGNLEPEEKSEIFYDLFNATIMYDENQVNTALEMIMHEDMPDATSAVFEAIKFLDTPEKIQIGEKLIKNNKYGAETIIENFDKPDVLERAKELLSTKTSEDRESDIVFVDDTKNHLIYSFRLFLEHGAGCEALLADKRFSIKDICDVAGYTDKIKERLIDTGLISQPDLDGETLKVVCSDYDADKIIIAAEKLNMSLNQMVKIKKEVRYHFQCINNDRVCNILKGHPEEEIIDFLKLSNVYNAHNFLEIEGCENLTLQQLKILLSSTYSTNGIKEMAENNLLQYLEKIPFNTLRNLASHPDILQKFREHNVLDKMGAKDEYSSYSLSFMQDKLNVLDTEPNADFLTEMISTDEISYFVLLDYGKAAIDLGLHYSPTEIKKVAEFIQYVEHCDSERNPSIQRMLSRAKEIGFDKFLAKANDPELIRQGKRILDFEETSSIFTYEESIAKSGNDDIKQNYQIIKDLLYGCETGQDGLRLSLSHCEQIAKLITQNPDGAERILEFVKKIPTRNMGEMSISRDLYPDFEESLKSLASLTPEQYEVAKEYFYIENREEQYSVDEIAIIAKSSPNARLRLKELNDIKQKNLDIMPPCETFNEEEFARFKEFYKAYDIYPIDKACYETAENFEKAKTLAEALKKANFGDFENTRDLYKYIMDSNARFQQLLKYLKKQLSLNVIETFMEYPSLYEEHEILIRDAFSKRDILKTGAGELDDSTIKRTFESEDVVRALGILGKTNLEAAFPMMIDEFKNFCKNVRRLKLSDSNMAALMRKINPKGTVKYFEMQFELNELKSKLDSVIGTEALEAIKGIDIEKSKVDEKLSELKVQAEELKKTSGDKTDEFIKLAAQIKELTKENKKLTAQKQGIYFSCENSNEVKKLFSEINAKTKEIREYLSSQENISPQEVIIKIRVLSGLQTICSEQEMADFIDMLKPSTPENDAAWNEAVNKKIFEKLGVSYSKELSDKLDLVSSKYISEMFVSSPAFYHNMNRLVEIIQENIDKPVEEILDQLNFNLKTKEEFAKYGIDYDRYTKVDKESFVKVGVELSADKIRQAAIENLEKEFNDDLFKKLPSEVTDKIFTALKEIGITFEKKHIDNFVGDGFNAGQSEFYMFMKDGEHITADLLPKLFSEIKKAINLDEFWTTENSDAQIETARTTIYSHIIHDRKADIERAQVIKEDVVSEIEVRKTDMYDIKKAIGLGNDGQCCTALGKNFNEWSAPNYIMTKAIGAIEVTDKGNFVGNTMMYFAMVDGELSLVLDNIELKTLYHNNDVIRDAIMKYAAQICEEVGKPDMHIYAGPHRHKLNMAIFEKAKHVMEFVGDSGENDVYIDYNAGHHFFGRGETTIIDMYKIR